MHESPPRRTFPYKSVLASKLHRLPTLDLQAKQGGIFEFLPTALVE
jgi:hypothetical protein